MEQRNVIEKENGIILKNQQDFELSHIFDCGQCFRWEREPDGSYTGVAYGKILNVNKIGQEIHFNHTNQKDFEEIWTGYFDLNTDYASIKQTLAKEDAVMEQAVAFGGGIRILRQDFWEALISFILSANNNIPRIKKIIGLISQRYGQYLGTFEGKDYYSFPEAAVLKEVSKEELMACNTGYRAGYIIAAAAQLLQRQTEIDRLQEADWENCHRWLMEFTGVGPKVANCIAFFSMSKLEAFPVDVWIKRLMEHFYFKEEKPAPYIERYAKTKFGQYAGYAQQYLFYYGRSLGIGKGER
ncbi:DNA-3-methyladenine glycosylase family protein [Alkaliphilus crotonatoxidans]